MVARANAGSSADKPDAPDVEMVESSVLKPAENPADFVVAWYNITWELGKLNGKDHEKHERLLRADLQHALLILGADIVLLSECGEIDKGLPEKRWVAILGAICGDDYDITHRSHYTAIVKKSTVRVLVGPVLRGPMTLLPDHYYRKCQYLKVAPNWQPKDSAFKPMDVFNVHSPASKDKPLGAQVRDAVTNWFRRRSGPNAMIGGDLNMSPFSLECAFDISSKSSEGYKLAMEKERGHGDIAVLKNMPGATSVPTFVTSTSKTHFMVAVSAPLKHLQYQKPAVSLVPCSAVKSADSPRAAAASTSSAAKSATP